MIRPSSSYPRSRSIASTVSASTHNRGNSLADFVSVLSDIYIAEISNNHNVAPKDLYIAIVSTIVETSTPELELRPGFDLLGPIHDKCVTFKFRVDLCQYLIGLRRRFVSVSSIYAPADSGTRDNIFVTKSYDATSHFESVQSAIPL